MRVGDNKLGLEMLVGVEMGLWCEIEGAIWWGLDMDGIEGALKVVTAPVKPRKSLKICSAISSLSASKSASSSCAVKEHMTMATSSTSTMTCLSIVFLLFCDFFVWETLFICDFSAPVKTQFAFLRKTVQQALWVSYFRTAYSIQLLQSRLAQWQ